MEKVIFDMLFLAPLQKKKMSIPEPDKKEKTPRAVVTDIDVVRCTHASVNI